MVQVTPVRLWWKLEPTKEKLTYYKGYESVDEAITRQVNEMVSGVVRKNQK